MFSLYVCFGWRDQLGGVFFGGLPPPKSNSSPLNFVFQPWGPVFFFRGVLCETSSGLVGCTPTNVPLWEISIEALYIYSGYSWVIIPRIPREHQLNTGVHCFGYTHPCPLILSFCGFCWVSDKTPMTLKFRYVLGVSYSYDVFRGGMSITILYIYILYIYMDGYVSIFSISFTLIYLCWALSKS